ncbi:translation elongation factor 4 [Candidatus Marinimicrobia bacterium]|jgi:GTP-binding protein LepA|nr:translation elongation factor 4 [Candidatus Neomarinimicrobiota bacterium]MDA9736079.1 translation elongation factor 4 [Candidatus Neomarinimicrobiota bacterium]GIR18755.1 MAG: elongation factor 4 [Candidatus Neomarinimicrobiota bacterium]
MSSTTKPIRNFCIIAHIDHGKSTLADRLLEHTGTISKKKMQDQVLDNMELERERGITIKSHSIRIDYNGHILNLIDTPGHVDFTYEVSRTLSASEGALLIVDAAQGIEAQTVTNYLLAIDNDLEIIPVINKVDLPNADIENVTSQIIELVGCSKDDILLASAKTGEGIEDILTTIIDKIPPPDEPKNEEFKGLIFDSIYDRYRGVVAYVRVYEGSLKKGSRIKFFAHNTHYDVDEVGHFVIERKKADSIKAGEVGYIIANVRDIEHVLAGDTVTNFNKPCKNPLPGFQKIKPMVFSGLFPSDAGDYDDLRTALEKLKLNDASLSFEPEVSDALGFGYRCGFLGLLHMEIIQERLEREFDLSIVTTSPNVKYLANLKDGSQVEVQRPALLPEPKFLESLMEPIVTAEILTPVDYIGNVMKICEEKRGKYKSTQYLSKSKVQLIYELPLGEILFDFYDKMKSGSKGYASFDYTFKEYQTSKLDKLDILINKEPVDALSMICAKKDSYHRGLALCQKLKELIPRHQIQIPIQASIGSRVIARTNIAPFRKNVTEKLYGGDVTRKNKLLQKQKKGKKRMRMIGRVEVPQEALLAVLKI